MSALNATAATAPLKLHSPVGDMQVFADLYRDLWSHRRCTVAAIGRLTMLKITGVAYECERPVRSKPTRRARP